MLSPLFIRKLIFLCVLSLITTNSYANNQACQIIQQQLVSWLQKNQPDDEFPPHAIEIVYTFNKLRANNVAHGGIHFGRASFLTAIKSNGTLETGTKGYTIDYNNPVRISPVADAVFSFHRNGRMEIRLPRWNNVVLPVHYANCYSDRFGSYVSGMRREGNGTSMVGITFRRVKY